MQNTEKQQMIDWDVPFNVQLIHSSYTLPLQWLRALSFWYDAETCFIFMFYVIFCLMYFGADSLLFSIDWLITCWIVIGKFINP